MHGSGSERQSDFDAIVVGAGIAGAGTAYQLAKRGKSVLLIEQFALSNNRNSSHGGSRIFRYAHGEDYLMPFAKDAMTEWRQLEKESGQELLRLCGFLWVGSHEGTEERAALLRTNNVPFTILKGREITERFPQFEFGDRWSAILDPNGGVLMADKCLKATLGCAKKYGAVIHEHEKVLRIEDGSVVEVYTDQAKYTAKKLFVTAGPWLKKLLPKLHINAEPQLMGVNYYQVTSHHELFKTENGCPTFLFSDHCDIVYALPDIDIPGAVKGGVHMGIRIDADGQRERPKWMQSIPAKHFTKHVKYMDSQNPIKQDNCMYTVTDDEQFIMDKSPMHKNVYIGGGFSGYGFKYGLTTGNILADMAYGKPIKFDVSKFKADRKIVHKAKL